jgi:hypothetical protein
MSTDTEPVVGTDLAKAAAALPALQRKPIIDSVPEEMLNLIAARANAGSKAPIMRGELSAFLELCAAYELDPFAGEVWLAKGSEDRVLIMVGRDGLRRIAKRNGIRVYCDVIHEEDEFRVAYARGEHEVSHGYSHPKDRGPIRGAWAVAVDEGGREVGFYVATIEEFKPTNDRQLRYSPWGAQESVMILAAAERQALRQATPLSGLVAQGELDRGAELAEGLPSREQEDERLNAVAVQFPQPVCARIIGTVERARELGHAGIADVAALEMALLNQDTQAAEDWCAESEAELDRHAEAQRPPEVVDAEPEPRCEVPDPARKGVVCALLRDHEGPHYADDQTWEPFLPDEAGDATADAERAQALRDEANTLLDRAQELREAIMDEDGAAGLEAEAEAKRDEADQLDPPQPDEGGLG